MLAETWNDAGGQPLGVVLLDVEGVLWGDQVNENAVIYAKNIPNLAGVASFRFVVGATAA